MNMEEMLAQAQKAAETIQKQMGDGAANALAPPKYWEPVKDPMQAEKFMLPEGAEKRKAEAGSIAGVKDAAALAAAPRLQLATALARWRGSLTTARTPPQVFGRHFPLLKYTRFHAAMGARDRLLAHIEAVIRTKRREVEVMIDGEVERMAMPLAFSIRPRALCVLAPAVDHASDDA